MNNTTIQTYTGRLVDLANPKPEDFCIEDIAHSLANQGRWTGHTREFYSVAQHSVVASFMIDESLTKDWDEIALLHDAGEAYYGDLATPFKVAMGEAYQVVKQPIDNAIYKAFNLEHESEQYQRIVKPVDRALLAFEGEWLMGMRDSYNPFKFRDLYPRQSFGKLMERCWSPGEAEERFLERWKELQ